MKQKMLLAGAAWISAWTLAGQVMASEQILHGPAPDWIIPTPVHRSNTPDDATQAIRFELMENQLYKADNGSAAYTKIRYKVLSPMAVQQASQLSVSWNPAFGSATIHSVELIRNGERINLLDKADFTILRREASLELSSQINGILTGVLIIPDLRVGDTIEMSQSIAASMPILGNAFEGLLPLMTPMTTDQTHMAIIWPKDHALSQRSGSEVTPPTVQTLGDYRVIQFNRTDSKGTHYPDDLTVISTLKNSFQFSDVASWNAVSERVKPLFDAATTLPDDTELQAHIARIKSEHSTPEARALAALRLVQEEVRYLAITIGEAGWQPASAPDVWRDRAGDCKGKTVLLIAILRELGIDAGAALTSAQYDHLDQFLPMFSVFDHVIVKARINGKDIYLDGTRTGDRSLTPDQPLPFSHVLPLVNNARLEALPLTLPPRPLGQTLLEIDMSAGLYSPARITASRVHRGDSAMVYMAAFSLPPTEVQQYSDQLWKGLLSDIGTLQDQQSRWEYLPDTHEAVFHVSGTAVLDWSNTASIPLAHVTWRANTARPEGPFVNDNRSTDYPSYSSFRTTLVLPEGNEPLDIKVDPYDVEASGVRYFRTVEREGNRLTVDRQRQTLRPESTAEEDREAQTILDTFKDKTTTMRPSRSYSMSASDQTTLTTVSSGDAEAALRRGYALLQVQNYQAAVQQFDAAIAGFDRPNANALANRAIASLFLEELDKAKADIAAADAITQTETITFHAKGQLAEIEKDDLEAVLAFSSAIQLWPENTYALYRRSAAYERMGQSARAIADLERVISLAPENADPVFALAGLHMRLGNVPAAQTHVKRAAEMTDQSRHEFFLFIYTLQKALDGVRESDPARAEATLTAALEVENDVPAILLERALMREAQGNLRGAGADKARFQQLTNVDLGDMASLCTLDRALRLYEYSRFAVVHICDQAIASGEDTAEVHMVRGNALYMLEKAGEARAAYARAQEIEPANAYALFGYGTLLVEGGETDRGEKMITDSRAANSNSHGHFPVTRNR